MTRNRPRGFRPPSVSSEDAGPVSRPAWGSVVHTPRVPGRPSTRGKDWSAPCSEPQGRWRDTSTLRSVTPVEFESLSVTLSVETSLPVVPRCKMDETGATDRRGRSQRNRYCGIATLPTQLSVVCLDDIVDGLRNVSPPHTPRVL